MFGSNGEPKPHRNILCWSKSHNFCVIKFWKMSVFGKLPSSNHHWTAYGSKLSCHFLHNLQFFTVNPRKESILYPPQVLTRNRSQRSSDRPKACWSLEMPTCLRRRHKEGCKRDYLPVYPIPSHSIPPSIYLSFYPSIHLSYIYLSIPMPMAKHMVYTWLITYGKIHSYRVWSCLVVGPTRPKQKSIFC